MSEFNLEESMKILCIDNHDVCELFDVVSRTVYRWKTKESEIPTYVKYCFKAWLRLRELYLAWDPRGIPIYEEKDLTNKIVHCVTTHKNEKMLEIFEPMPFREPSDILKKLSKLPYGTF